MAVINVFAASKKAATLWTKAEDVLKSRNVAYHTRFTGASGSAAEITFDACVVGYRRFLAVGGDGTVHDVLDGIAAYIDWTSQTGRKLGFNDFTIGVIPVGSGNDWIKSSGIPNDLEKAAEVVAAGNSRFQDVVRASVLDPRSFDAGAPLAVSYMINVGGVGIDARVCEIVNRKKSQGRRGRMLYVSALAQAIWKRKSAYAKVCCDNELVYDGAYLSMAFGTGRYSGGGMRQTPYAVMDDGMLDMTVIPELPLLKIMREAPRLFTGTLAEVSELKIAKGRVIDVLPYEDTSAEPVEVDGEVIGKAPVRFEVLDTQINVVCV